MLTKEILQALKGYAESMQKEVTFVLQTGEHSKRDELVTFLSDIAGVSKNIHFEERDTSGVLRSSLSFLLEADGEDTGIRFSGIPAGHEFNSLVLAMLHASGTALKVDDSLQSIVKGVKEDLNFEVFISLSCHNCPEVVQALNQFALINPHIKTEMIDTLPEEYLNTIIKSIPAKKLGSTDDVSKLVLFLASNESDYITGQIISVDGGMNI